MKRLIGIFLMIVLLASCVAPLPQPEPERQWEFPPPQGLFAFHSFDAAGGRNLYGLVSAQGEVVVPIEYEHIEVMRSFTAHRNTALSIDVPAGERFFVVRQHIEDQEEPGYFSYGAAALVSPDGNFLTGFYYSNIFHAPDTPADIIGWRRDGRLVFLDYYGVESDLDDGELLYLLGLEFHQLRESEPPPSVPDAPEQGLEGIMRTRWDNFWGISNPPEGGRLREIRLYSSDGYLLTRDVYNRVSYIGGGLYAASQGAERPFESFIVNQVGRRLAGPYESFISNIELPYVLGRLGGTAYVICTDSFHELHSVSLPENGSVRLIGSINQPFVEILCFAQGLTLVMLPSGEEIIFDNARFGSPQLRYHNEDLSRFVLRVGREGGSILVDRQGNILASGYSVIRNSRLGYLVAVSRIQADEENEQAETRYSLLDWDGNILLGPEFSFLQPLPGNALHVVRDGVVGLTDLGGNWIFVHSTLPPGTRLPSGGR